MRRRDQHPHAVGQAAFGHRRGGRRHLGAGLGQGRALFGRQQGGRLARRSQGGDRHRRIHVHLLNRRRIGGVCGQVADGRLTLRRQIAGGHALDVRGGDGLDLGDLAIGGRGVAGVDQSKAQRGGAVVHGLSAAQGRGHQLVLGLGQLGLADRLLAQAGDLGVQGGDPFLGRVALRHDGERAEIAGLLGEVGGGADLGRDLLVVHQRAVQPAAFAGGQHAVQHRQGRAVRIRVLHRRPGDHHGRQRHVGRIVGDLARAGRLGLGDVVGRDGGRGVLQRREILIDPAIQLRLVEVARDDQIGVVRAVVGAVKAQHILKGRGLQLLDRADARPPIGALLIDGLGHEQAEQPAIGIGQDALAVFFLHHVALGHEGRLVHHQRAHALGFGEQHPLKVVGRHRLEIGGGVIGGEGVVGAAHVLGQPVKGLWRQVARRLEHQVFEQVGEAGATRRIVLGPDLVPDLDGDVGGVGVARRIDLEPVRQHPLVEAQRRHDHAGRRLRRGRLGSLISVGGLRRRGGGAGGEPQHQGRCGHGGGQADLHRQASSSARPSGPEILTSDRGARILQTCNVGPAHRAGERRRRVFGFSVRTPRRRSRRRPSARPASCPGC